MPIHEVEIFYPESKQAWRQWLEQNHIRKNAVWVVFYKKAANRPTLSWSDAVDEALCFGWIDSVKKTYDAESAIQFFSKRKPKSTWSKINKDKVERLQEAGLMTQAGLDCIAVAKTNGSWEILDAIEALTLPEDLETALQAKEEALEYFLSLSKSTRKAVLAWLVLARRPETRQKRIAEITECASRKQKPKPF